MKMIVMVVINKKTRISHKNKIIIKETLIKELHSKKSSSRLIQMDFLMTKIILTVKNSNQISVVKRKNSKCLGDNKMI